MNNPDKGNPGASWPPLGSKISTMEQKYYPNIKSLVAENNYSYDQEHGLNEQDLALVNFLISRIGYMRGKWKVNPGDVVKCGEKECFIESIHKGIARVCEMRCHPYTSLEEGALWYSKPMFSASGGPWGYMPTDDFQPVGTTESSFWTFGHCGATGNGGIDFRANVQLWESKLKPE